MVDSNSSQILIRQLSQDGYCESNLCHILGLSSLAGFDAELSVGYLRRCQKDGSPAADWLAFWIFGQPQERSGAWVDWLEELALLERQGAMVKACLQLWPVSGLYLWGERPSSQQLTLASQPRTPGESLHLGCGNGLLPLLHAQEGQIAYGCDELWVLQIASFNAAFNGLTECHFSPQWPAAKFSRVTVCLPLQPLSRGQLPDLLTPQKVHHWLELLAEGGSLDINGYWGDFPGNWQKLAEGWRVECQSQSPCSLEDYAAWLSNRAQLIAAFGPELGDQAYQQEVQGRLEAFLASGLTSLEQVHLRICQGATGFSKAPAPLPIETAWRSEEPPDPSPWAGWLAQQGYHEEGLRQLIGLPEPLFSWSQRPGLRQRLLQADSRAAQLASHFLLQEPGHLEQLLAPQWWERYQRDQLQNEELMLFPCLGQAIFTDSIFSARDDQVYWLGPDSLALARCAPRRPGRSLDLCTGSGVQAVLNATCSEQVLAVDLNPRAVKLCQLNASWNAHPIETYLGDLYQPLPPGKFRLITANPPFVPTPREDALQLFRPGGESGEEITAAIVGGLGEWLEVGGMLALVSQCPDIQNSDPLERMHSWLGYQKGWGLAQLRLDYLPRENLIAGHVTSPQQYERWWDCYEAQGILGSHLTVSFVLRLDPQRPVWKASCQRPMPRHCCWRQVEAWLQECDGQAI